MVQLLLLNSSFLQRIECSFLSSNIQSDSAQITVVLEKATSSLQNYLSTINVLLLILTVSDKTILWIWHTNKTFKNIVSDRFFFFIRLKDKHTDQ